MEPTTSRQSPTFGGVHHLALTVRDVDSSSRWYQRVLGFRLVSDTTIADRSRTVVLGAESGSFFVSLVRHSGSSGDVFDERRTGLDHLSLGLASRDELRRWRERLDAEGVEHSPLGEGVFGVVLVFRDPDNIQLEFTAK